MFIWSPESNFVIYVPVDAAGYGNTSSLCVWMVVPSDAY